ncbi:calmodulin-regulated spectrin-associated protein 3-like isoform X1 [Poeciliopsis prolifica]|uniref:calmodulin-regulated spectrin-associated protein 3-like isoform X1 n=1 Tax=Poeciliopsis prolifica TaxID=188132 RepID=UPI0024133C69|nr:calmodulin-regulated spectrin-associated protein 3-like isoform X1 [Poeciliopsis prolifica]
MVDSPSAMKKTFAVPEIKPLDKYDSARARMSASVRWLLSKSYGSAENVPVELREPLYRDQYEEEYLKPSVAKLLLSPEIYCRTQALLAQGHKGPAPAPQGPPTDNSALLQFLTKKGFCPKVREADVTEEDLSKNPINTKAHLALIDSLMSLSAKEATEQVKMAAEAEQIGVGAPWENALLFWVNRLNQKLRESTEEEELPKSQTCTDLQPVQESCQSNRWYWKLVPHAIAFCLKESGNKPPVIRYRKDKVQSKLTPTFPLVSAVKDLSNGCAIAAVLHYYCPGLLPLEDVCLKDTMSVADSVYNLQLIKEFCESNLQSCCPLAVEDLLYAPPALHLNMMSFIAELLEWFEVKKPDFVKPIQPIDLTDVSGLLGCASPVSGNSNSGSPSFIFKQPFVPISSPMSPENKSWTKKQISRPLSAVTFSIPFGLDSDVDIVMGNPIDSVFRSVSTDNLATGIPALSSPAAAAGMTRVPFSPPEDLSHLVSASAPSQRSSWVPYAQTAPLGELPTIEEARQVVHKPGGKDRKKGRSTEKSGRDGLTSRPEPRLCPEGAPAGFFLHSPEVDGPLLSSSAPCRSGIQYRPVRGDAGSAERQGRRERSRKHSDMSRDDDSVLRDGSIDSSEASDDATRNAPGNIRPSAGRESHNSSSPRMTSFAERRDNKRRHPTTPGEELTSAPTPTTPTPGTPHTPSTPVSSQQGSPGLRGPEPGSEAWELGARLEEKRKNIEAQKRRIEAIFARHRQRLGKNAFLQLKREQGEGGVEGTEEDGLTLEERLTRMEEQLKQEEEKETEKDKPPVSNPPRLEKQVTFSVDSKKAGEKEKGAEMGEKKGTEKGGEGVIVEYNEVVQKLSEALQSLQKDMQKLTEQQQQLMSNQRPRNTPKTAPRSSSKTPPHTPTKTPPRTPTRTPSRSATKAWVIPAASNTPPASSPSRRSHLPSSSASPKAVISSSCPAPRTKLHSSSSSPRSPKHNTRPHHHQPHPRPSELKFPPLNRVLTPTQNVDTIPHLRRVSPSKCQVQTSSSFRIGGPRTPQEPPLPIQQPPPPPDESTSDTGSSETPTQFSLELEQEDSESIGALPVLPQFRQERPRAAGGSSSGAPSECSFESDTLSLSAAFSTGGEGERDDGPRQPCPIAVSLSSVGGPEVGSDEPTDEGQEFSSDSMSDHTESATEAAGGPAPQQQGATNPLHGATEGSDRPEAQTEPVEEHSGFTEAAEPRGEKKEHGTRGGVGFFFKEDVHSEGEMAQRRALLLERQQKRTEELRRRRQWHERERETRPASSERRAPSPANTSPSPTPPATPARRGDFTRGEYEWRQQLRIMEDLDKVLKQKTTNHPGRTATKKTRSRPRSMTREETKLSLSPAKGAAGSQLTKVYSHSSLNLAATDEPGNNGDSTKKAQSRVDSPSRCVTPGRAINQNGDRDWESGSNGTSPAPEYTGPKLFKEPSLKSNKFIIHNALSRCCLAGKVNESQKNKIVEEMEKSSANHFLILFRDSNCQFRGVYTMSPDSQELVRLAGVGPRSVSSGQVESIFKYSSDRKQFSSIPSKTMGMSVDAFTIPSQLWQGGGGGGGAGASGSRRASVTKKVAVSK